MKLPRLAWLQAASGSICIPQDAVAFLSFNSCNVLIKRSSVKKVVEVPASLTAIRNSQYYWLLKCFPLDLNSLLFYLIYSPHFITRFLFWFSSFEKNPKSLISVCWASPIQVSQLQVLFPASMHFHSCFWTHLWFFDNCSFPAYLPAATNLLYQVTFLSVCLLVLLELPAVVVITDNTTL